MTDWLGPVANKYGLILLTSTEYETGTIDAALKEVLRRFAVDPAKIAIVGRCASGNAGMAFGINNLNVFSRIVSISGGITIDGMDPQNKTVEFLLDRSYHEAGGLFPTARELRKAGHPVKVVLALRGHEHQTEDYDFLGHWLQETWTTPNPAVRPAPAVVADPLPLLTPEVLIQMTTFWTSFLKEPDSIRKTARRAHLREIVVPVGEERPSAWMTDMPALAAKYPSVAADLKSAGLTAPQHEAYRVALISAQVTKAAQGEVGTIDPSSAMAKNVAYFDAHQDEFDTLEKAGVEQPDAIDEVNQTATIQHPDMAESMGAMGIWRTP